MRNVQSDVAFFIGNDATDTNHMDLSGAAEEKGDSGIGLNSKHTGHNYQHNIISFASPKHILKEQKQQLAKRFGSSKAMERSQSESAQARSPLVNPDVSSTNTICGSLNSNKSPNSGNLNVKMLDDD